MVALTTEQYKNIIEVMKRGFKNGNKEFMGNNRIATALIIQANLGLRIGDILNLRLQDIIRDGDRYRLNIIEEKTEKRRSFTVPAEIYNYIKMYVLENNIRVTARIFNITVRAVQKQLKLVTQFLNLENISSHSFRYL
ncbi:tyrosine-type recombinase/integrase [Clostridium lacusfryxellense]|nr:tyrosine-type recombinase/integrase [Clostridium lacusfryxellense]